MLNAAKRAEAIAIWRAGTMTLEELAKKFKVNKRTLTRLFEREGVKKNENEENTKKIVEDALEANLKKEAAIYAERVKDTKEEHYKMSNTLAKLVFSKVVKVEKEGKAVSTIAGDVKALQLAMATIRMAREERYATLGIRADDVAEDKPLPDLIIQELSVEDIQEMSKGNMVNDDELDFDDNLGDEDFIDKEEQDERVIVD
jgi:nucleotidyltransferase/DNA polymerase involved in DNA repair